MRSLGLLVILLTAASAFPSDRIFYRCVPFLSDHSFHFQEVSYLCDTNDGVRFLVAKDFFDNIVHQGRVLSDEDMVNFPYHQRILPLLGGLGGSGSQSSSGSIGGSIGGGLLPFQVGGSLSGSQSSAAAGSGAGVLGLLG